MAQSPLKKYMLLAITILATVGIAAVFYACSSDGPSGVGSGGATGATQTTVVGSSS